MKVLYLPIFEPGQHHDTATVNKRGLFDALVAYGCEVYEFDYLAQQQGLEDKLHAILASFQPDLLLTQLHGHDPLTVGMAQRIRENNPALKWVNWSGDSWRHGLVGEKYLPLVREFDLQLCAAPDILPEYAALGIPARFWQIAYERPVGELPDVPAYDVVFLGNVITEARRRMMDMLRSLDGLRVGIFGDWQHADGVNKYDFGTGEALYKRAKVAIADNTYPEQLNYTSDRPIQVLMAGGATLLHQHVPRMDVLLGIQAGKHFVEWSDLDDLRFKVRYWCEQYGTNPQRRMVREGQEYARAHHTWDCRVKQLFEEYMPEVAGVKA